MAWWEGSWDGLKEECGGDIGVAPPHSHHQQLRLGVRLGSVRARYDSIPWWPQQAPRPRWLDQERKEVYVKRNKKRKKYISKQIVQMIEEKL